MMSVKWLSSIPDVWHFEHHAAVRVYLRLCAKGLRLQSSGKWLHVVQYIGTNISGQPAAFIFRVTLLPWGWKHKDSLKRLVPTYQANHVTFQKAIILISYKFTTHSRHNEMYFDKIHCKKNNSQWQQYMLYGFRTKPDATNWRPLICQINLVMGFHVTKDLYNAKQYNANSDARTSFWKHTLTVQRKYCNKMDKLLETCTNRATQVLQQDGQASGNTH
jgi:hypothetical protein